MTSLAAEQVAKEVLGTIGKGEIPNITKIAIKKGYTPKTANSGQVQKTKTYQSAIRPVVEMLEAERLAILERLPHVRDKAKYRDLTDGLDKITKTHQLLTGGATENIAVKPLATLDELRQDDSHS